MSDTEPAMTLSQLAAYPSVSAQAYDLRSQGRGPRGFRVGRQLRFRTAEIEARLTRMEAGTASAMHLEVEREPGDRGPRSEPSVSCGTFRYRLDHRVVPSCWAEQGELVEELSALHLAWQVAYASTSSGTLRWGGTNDSRSRDSDSATG